MATDVVMPTLGLTMEEGTILRWLKQEGETVQKDEPLFEVETDKAAMEVPAPASGVLHRILADAGATVPTRQAIAIIGAPGEAVAGLAGAAPTSASAATGGAQAAAPAGAPAAPQPPAGEGAGRQSASPRARRVARELGVSLVQLVGSGPSGRIVERDVRAAAAAPKAERVLASPLAKRLAAEHGVDLARLRGTGPGGRIIERDVEAAVAARAGAPASAPTAAPAAAPTPAPVPAAAPTAAATPAPVAGEVGPLTRIRRLPAERMTASSRAVARVTEF
ncbi:MAG: E3 binding domain-containing protein, partial [Chloroflexi bacterium]|nr:E3 binding domain-containing protein [Chloroflexota bacterium]